uniref:Uncharacterized protein n=1 Tax=Triticum urartu TaxID=4572 RepID=A0A8R7Q7Z4_TRIUA
MVVQLCSDVVAACPGRSDGRSSRGGWWRWFDSGLSGVGAAGPYASCAAAARYGDVGSGGATELGSTVGVKWDGGALSTCFWLGHALEWSDFSSEAGLAGALSSLDDLVPV